MRVAAIVAAAMLSACGGTISRQSVQSARPIPEMPPAAAAEIRGTQEMADRISGEDEVLMISEIVRRFFRPLRGQARWIDVRPLAHRRTRAADSLAAADGGRAQAIVDGVALTTVCHLTEANARCQGRPGGVLTFSAPYALGPDSAAVFVRYTAVATGAMPVAGDGFEMEFHAVRRELAWTITGRRTVAGPDRR
jgi:hypothetical protein